MSSNDQDIMVEKISIIIYEDLLHGSKKTHEREELKLLKSSVGELTSKRFPIRIVLSQIYPFNNLCEAQDMYSTNDEQSSMSFIQKITKTARKLQELYSGVIKFTILLHNHTFDKYFGITSEIDNIYAEKINKIVEIIGADDIIKFISLSTFPELSDMPAKDISRHLFAMYGGEELVDRFDEKLIDDKCFFEKYKELRNFVQSNQLHYRSNSTNSESKDRCLQNLVIKGMLVQRCVLDSFMRKQTHIKNFIRLNVNHQCLSAKF